MSDPLNIRVGRSSNGATPVNLDTDRVRPGEWWNVEYVSLSNISGESVTVQLAVLTGSETDYLGAALTAANGAGISAVGPFTIGEGQQVRAIITGSADSGPVMLVLMGTHEYIRED